MTNSSYVCYLAKVYLSHRSRLGIEHKTRRTTCTLMSLGALTNYAIKTKLTKSLIEWHYEAGLNFNIFDCSQKNSFVRVGLGQNTFFHQIFDNFWKILKNYLMKPTLRFAWLSSWRGNELLSLRDRMSKNLSTAVIR